MFEDKAFPIGVCALLGFRLPTLQVFARRFEAGLRQNCITYKRRSDSQKNETMAYQ